MQTVFRIIIFLLCAALQGSVLLAQDQIFMRQNQQVIYCYILQADDSLIVFRSADPDDTGIYEISFSATYGFLLEEPLDKPGGKKSPALQLRIYHPDKKRYRIFNEDRGIVFKLKGDTSSTPRRGRITRISADSIEIETKINLKKDLYTFAIADFEYFGYRTGITELLSLIVFPFPAKNEEPTFFFRKMAISNGWKYQVQAFRKRKSKIPRRWKKIRAVGVVRRKPAASGKF